MSIQDITSNVLVSTVIHLFNPATEEIETPLDFDAATDDDIQAGDFVYTRFGWWGVVNTVKTTSSGQIGYSINLLYRTNEGRWIAPRNTSRMWVWESEIVEVLS